MPNQWARFTQLQSRDFSMSQLGHNPQDYNPINYHTTPLGAISLAINANTRGTISEAYSGGGLLGLGPPPPPGPVKSIYFRWFLCPNGCWQPPSKEIKFKPPLDKFLNTPLHNLHLLCLEQRHDYSLRVISTESLSQLVYLSFICYKIKLIDVITIPTSSWLV